MDVCATITLDSQIISNGVIGYLHSEYAPAQNYVIFSVRTGSDYQESGTIWIYADGTVRIYGNVPSGSGFYIEGMYLCGS